MPYDTLTLLEEGARSIDHPFVVFSSNPASFPRFYQDYASVKFPNFQMTSRLPGAAKQIEDRFRELASEWQAAVAPLSSIRRKLNHPLYGEIVAMGKPVIPFILVCLKNRPSHLVWALADITGEDPADRSKAKNILDVIDAWLAWGRNQGYEV